MPYTVRFSTIPGSLPRLYHLVTFAFFRICSGSPVQSGAKRLKLKIQRLVCWEREKQTGTRECCRVTRFNSEDQNSFFPSLKVNKNNFFWKLIKNEIEWHHSWCHKDIIDQFKGDNPSSWFDCWEKHISTIWGDFHLTFSAMIDIAVMYCVHCRKFELYQVGFNMHFSQNQLGQSAPVIADFCYMFVFYGKIYQS